MNEYLHLGITVVVGLIAYLGNRSVNAVEAAIVETKNEVSDIRKDHDERLREHGEAIAAIRAVMDHVDKTE